MVADNCDVPVGEVPLAACEVPGTCDSLIADAIWDFRLVGITSLDAERVLVLGLVFFFFPVMIMVGDDPAVALFGISSLGVALLKSERV